MFFLPIFAELGTDIPWLKKQAVQNFLDVVNRIVENGYQMIDWNGKRIVPSKKYISYII